MADWPEIVGLSVGESVQRTYDSGTWTLSLTSYTVVTNRENIQATWNVTGPSSYNKSFTTRVSMGQSDIVLGGFRIFACAWKEADDDGGLEPVGQQGALPAGLNTGANDIAFLLNDAADGLFPDGSYMYSGKPWLGVHWQNFLETDGWAHSGHDVPMPGGTWFVAPYNGWIFPALGGQMVFVPDLEPNDSWSPASGTNAASGSWSSAPLTIIQTHTTDATAQFSNGAWVTEGTQCVQSNNVDRHFHAGSKGHQAGGSFYYDVWLWNTNEGATWQGPRWWHTSPAQPNVQADTLSFPGNPNTGTMTRLVDGLTRGILPMHKVLPQNQYSNPSTRGSAAFSGSWVWSPSAQSATLRLGATRKARVWVNGTLVTTLDNSSRYANVQETTQPVLVHDERVVAGIQLSAGWNSLVVGSDDTNGSQRTWVHSVKLEGASQVCTFSTRAMGLSSNGTTLSWSLPSHHNLAYDRTVLQISTSRTFNSVTTYDAGSNTSVAISSLTLTPGVTNYVRAVPRDTALGLYLDVSDVVDVEPGGELSIPPAQSSPLPTAQTPQFVLLGSDDNNRAGGMEFFRNAFSGRFNPDGTPAQMSFYLIGTNIYGPNISSNEWRNEYMALYQAGHELGNHGFHGLASDAARGSVNNWLNNWMQPTHDAMVQMFVAYGYSEATANEHIKGYRYAQDVLDQYGPDALKQMGYYYQNSSVTNHSTNLPAWFPGTIENGWPGGADWDNRDFGDTEGIMEIPQTYEVGGSRYCDKDWLDQTATNDVNGTNWLAAMQTAFQALYNGNRAPFSLCLHSQNWGPTNTTANGGVPTANIAACQARMNELLDWLLSGAFPDVRIITHRDMYEWMLAPVALGSEPGPGQTITQASPVRINVDTPAGSISSGDAPDYFVTADATSVVNTRPDLFLQTALSVWVYPATAGASAYPGPASDALLVQGLKAGKFRIARWGGGNWTNRIGWQRNNDNNEGATWTYEDVDPDSLTFGEDHEYGHIYNAKMMTNLGTLRSLVPGLAIMLEVNVKDNNPDMWLDLLRYCNAEGRNIGIEWIEIGNEQDLGGQRTWGDGSHLVNAQEYSRRWVRYWPILKQVNAEKDPGMPDIKILGPVIANPAQGGSGYSGSGSYDIWWNTFKEYCDDAGIVPDALTWHYYPSSFVNAPASDIDRSRAAAAAMSYDKFISSNGSSWTAGQTVADTHFMIVLKRKFAELQMADIKARTIEASPSWANIPMFITETRPWSQNANELAHRTGVNVSWFLDIAQRQMKLGLGGTMWYTFREANESAGALGNSRVQMPFYGPYLLAQLQGSENLTVTVSQTGFPGHASRDASGNVYFTVVNPDSVTRTIQMELSGVAPGEYTQATLYKFNATSGFDTVLNADSGQDVDVNGHRFSNSTATTVEAKIQALFDAGIDSELSNNIYQLALEPFQPAIVVFGIGEPPSVQTLFQTNTLGLTVDTPAASIVSVEVTEQTLTQASTLSIEVTAPAGSIASQTLEVIEVAEAAGATLTFSGVPDDGEMLMLIAHQDTLAATSVPTFTWPAGFTELRQSNGSAVAYKEASSEAGASYTVTSSIPSSSASVRVAASSDDATDHTPGFIGYTHVGTALYSGLSSGQGFTIGARFLGVNIPAGAVITGARVKLQDLAFEGGTHTLGAVGFEDTASPATFSSGTRPKLRTMTTARLTSQTMTEPVPEGIWTSGELTESVQELVDTYGAITDAVVLIDGTGAASYNTWYSYDNTPSKAPLLEIEWQAQEITVHGMRASKGQVNWTVIGHQGVTGTGTSVTTSSVNSQLAPFIAFGSAIAENNASAFTGSNSFGGTATGGSLTEDDDVRSVTQDATKIKSTSAYRVFSGAGTVTYTSKSSTSDRMNGLVVLFTDASNLTLTQSAALSVTLALPQGHAFITASIRQQVALRLRISATSTGAWDGEADYDAPLQYDLGGFPATISNVAEQGLTQAATLGVDIALPAAAIAGTSVQTLTQAATLSVELALPAGELFVSQTLEMNDALSIPVDAITGTIANSGGQTLAQSGTLSLEVGLIVGSLSTRPIREGVLGRGRYARQVQGEGRV